MYKSVRGTKDILPPEVFWWQDIEAKARDILTIYGYQEIRTPLIEDIGLFRRSLGTFSDVVNKQMFLVKRLSGLVSEEDKEKMVLRPEGTASVVRAYLQNRIDKTLDFVKFFYIGAMFRAERPQKGRLRQFHHLGVEAIGSYSVYLDIELIMLVQHLLEEFGVEDFTINLNSIGCNNDKNKLALFIKNTLKTKIIAFCKDCQRRYETNILRILDCKNRNCQEILKGIKIKEDYLCNECLVHFNELREGLDSLQIKYKLSPFLVRGLDYYTRTVFEITQKDLGSQDAIGAGGRYDDLVKELGGQPQGAVGFALGLERVLLAKKQKELPSQRVLIFLILLGERAKREGLKILKILRQNKICADMDYQEKSLKAALRRADSLKARFVVILGEQELDKKILQLKDMQKGLQREISIEELLRNPKSYLC
ncbi:MAG: histidine--tRNA ligase [Candidatus Omnitrophica bacterium]|nr:histidine--tRNA ligase [Candidatus Omnitrophota bacterium]